MTSPFCSAVRMIYFRKEHFIMKKLISLILALCLVLSLCACGGSAKTEAPAETPATAAPAAPETEPESEPASGTDLPPVPLPASDSDLTVVDAELPVSVMVLSGTTGFGMAKLIDDAANGAAALNYSFSVETDASNVTAALVNGSCDIAALPTNAASALYNKTEGKVQCLALNTLGVLYLVADSTAETISSLADLDGKTVYAPAQNPSFIFSALCNAAGVNVTVDNTYAQPADLRTAVAAGEVSLAVLPEPMVTIARAANDKLTAALDLTAEWDAVFPAGSLVQGCVVVRTEFAEAHPAEVAKFLKEYEVSIAFLEENIDAAAEMIVSAGIFSAAPVAKKAIPNCNVCFIAGEDMQKALSSFLEVMHTAAPASIGGKIPGDDFYCIF